jgi:hypothetical protein
MKKLILIQNDYPSTGKSTLARSFSHYLSRYGVSHQLRSLIEETDCEDEEHLIDASRLTPRSFVQILDQEAITILEVGTGQGDFFNRFYQNHDLGTVLDELGVALTVVLPVTSESDSFDAVVEAAEVYSDHAEYLIAHLITSSYEDDDKLWDTSYAARVMDMFEAVELHIPEVGFHTDNELRAHHIELSDALSDMQLHEALGKDFGKWYQRVMGQIDSVRQYLFGEAFKPTTLPKIEKPERRTRSRVRAA